MTESSGGLLHDNSHPAFLGVPPFAPIRPRCSRFRRHPFRRAEHAVHHPRYGVILVELRPVQAMADGRYLDLGELFGRGIAKALHQRRGEGEGGAAGEVYHDPIGLRVIARRDRARLACLSDPALLIGGLDP